MARLIVTVLVVVGGVHDRCGCLIAGGVTTAAKGLTSGSASHFALGWCLGDGDPQGLGRAEGLLHGVVGGPNLGKNGRVELGVGGDPGSGTRRLRRRLTRRGGLVDGGTLCGQLPDDGTRCGKGGVLQQLVRGILRHG